MTARYNLSSIYFYFIIRKLSAEKILRGEAMLHEWSRNVGSFLNLHLNSKILCVCVRCTI